MGLSFDAGIPVLTVFIQGLISFFSPCVLPLIPLYMGYLSGGTRKIDENGKVSFDKKKVTINTLFFVIGISFTFFLLGFGASLLGSFFKNSQGIFARIGGIIIVLFGLYQLGVFGSSKTLSQEKRLSLRLDKMAMSPLTALLMGFTFSFAWTPCVGPALSSVLLMTASANTKAWAYVLIGVYTLGFIIPFLAVGFFSTYLLDLFKKHSNIVKYTVKVGGVLMIMIGVMMFTGKMNAFTGYISNPSNSSVAEKSNTENEENSKAENDGNSKDSESNSGENKDTEKSETKEDENEFPLAPDIVLNDQYGVEHRLSDYKGKVIFLNFWATWCPPCRGEMPEIQQLYEKYNTEDSNVVVLGIAAPGYGRETSVEGVAQFLEENNYTYPVLMDVGGKYFSEMAISSYPTTFMITDDGKIFGFVRGAISYDIMEDIIRQTLEYK